MINSPQPAKRHGREGHARQVDAQGKKEGKVNK